MHEFIEEAIAAAELPEGFSLPEWEAPLDVDACISRAPAGATAKGMFLVGLQREARRMGQPFADDRRFYPFHDYPIRECISLLAEAARTLYPDDPLREGVRRLSWLAYDIFASSLIGKVIFGFYAGDPAGILKLAAKGVSRAASMGKIRHEPIDDHTCLLHYSDIFVFPEVFSVGVAEGVLRSCRRPGSVAHKLTSDSEGVLWVRWD